jgi:CMP/dCMP kinase
MRSACILLASNIVAEGRRAVPASGTPGMSFTVAIDGPAAAGKGTIARAVAAHFGFAHLDTGLLYRATGRRTLDGTPPVEAARALTAADLRDEAALRTEDAGQAASRVAALPEVRAALVDFQRAFATRMGGAVLDGRDIGTVICPDAAVKLFVTASDEVRARRRHAELVSKGHDVTLEDVAADLATRDARDKGRTDAPLKPAEDALVLDTSGMSIESAVATAIAAVEAARRS